MLGLCGRACVQEGFYVCHYGQTTGRECGYVLSKDSSPGYVPSPSNTWVSVYKEKGGSRLSDGGDSGGPWYAGSTAYGIHSGGSESQNFWFAYYMPINYINELAVEVQTG